MARAARRRSKSALVVALLGVSPVIAAGAYGVAHGGEDMWGLAVNVLPAFAVLFGGSMAAMGGGVALRAAGGGFGVAALLFSLSRWAGAANWLAWHSMLTMIVCPPSLMSMALDRAGPVETLAAWFYIAVINAALYALAAAGVSWLYRRAQQ